MRLAGRQPQWSMWSTDAKKSNADLLKWNPTLSLELPILAEVAGQGGGDGFMTYTDLIEHMQGIRFEFPSYALNEMLSEIAMAEYRAGRGLLTATVVYKDAFEPGPGWYEVAKYLGIDVSTLEKREQFWIDQLKVIHDHWTQAVVSKSPLRRKLMRPQEG
jgi:hypothetical protein